MFFTQIYTTDITSMNVFITKNPVANTAGMSVLVANGLTTAAAERRMLTADTSAAYYANIITINTVRLTAFFASVAMS